IIITFAYVLALASRMKDTLTMLDWGGGIGHFNQLARALIPDVAIHYHCKDVPVLANHGQTLFPDATFFVDNRCLAQSYDLVLASASLHYSEDWREALARLARSTSGYLFVTQVPM